VSFTAATTTSIYNKMQASDRVTANYILKFKNIFIILKRYLQHQQRFRWNKPDIRRLWNFGEFSFSCVGRHLNLLVVNRNNRACIFGQ